MTTKQRRAIIRLKIEEGLLPRQPADRVWAGPGNGETCNGCEERIAKAQTVYEWEHGDGKVQLHLGCYQIWNELRQKPRPRRRPRQ